MQEKVYESRIEDVDELRERIKAAWEELDQRVIDGRYCSQAVAQSPSACVKAKGDHFEHKLPWLNDEMPDKLFNRSILTFGFYYDFRISDQMRC